MLNKSQLHYLVEHALIVERHWTTNNITQYDAEDLLHLLRQVDEKYLEQCKGLKEVIQHCVTASNWAVDRVRPLPSLILSELVTVLNAAQPDGFYCNVTSLQAFKIKPDSDFPNTKAC